MAELQQVKLSQLHESPFNPRQKFDGLDELAESIRANGVIQPLIVRKVNGDGALEIVAGARRFRAAKLAKTETVPVLVRNLNDAEARTEQILENLQREGIAPLEEAAAYQALLKAHNSALPAQERGTGGAVARPLDVEQLAARVGKSKRYVYGRLELLKLTAPVQKALAAGKIEPSAAQELVPLKPEQQKDILGAIETEQKYGRSMSVEDVRDEISTRYRPKREVSAKEKARRAIETAAQKKRDLAWKREQAKSDAERQLRARVNARAAAALWPKLKAANAKAREGFLDTILTDAANRRHAGSAWEVAAGKTLPERYVLLPIARFAKRPRNERIAIVMLATAIDLAGYRDKEIEPLYRWAKIDRKAIAKQIQAEEKAGAAAKAESKRVQISANARKAALAAGNRRTRAKVARGKKAKAKK